MHRLFFKGFILLFVFLVPISFLNTQYIYAATLSEEATVYRQKGYDAQELGDIEEAITWYQKAASLDATYPAPHNDLGILFEAKGWLDRAEKEYQKAIAIDPNYEKSHTNLALLYERKGELEKAAFHWMRRYKLGDPNDPWTYEARQRLEKLGLLDKAETGKLKARPDKTIRERGGPLKKKAIEKKIDKEKASEWTRIDFKGGEKEKAMPKEVTKTKKTAKAKKIAKTSRPKGQKVSGTKKQDLDKELQESLRLAEKRLREEKEKKVSGASRTKKETPARKKIIGKAPDAGTGSDYAKARNYYEKGEYSRALDAIRSAKKDSPNDPSLEKLEETVKNKMKEERIGDHYNEGIMRYQQQDFSGARKEFEAILSILPE